MPNLDGKGPRKAGRRMRSGAVCPQNPEDPDQPGGSSKLLSTFLGSGRLINLENVITVISVIGGISGFLVRSLKKNKLVLPNAGPDAESVIEIIPETDDTGQNKP